MAGVTSTQERAGPTGRRVALGPVSGRGPGRADPVLLLIVALGAFLRFFRIGRQSLWFDEYFTTLVLGSGRHMFGYIAHAEGTPPLYYVVLKGWETVIGGGDGALRSLSALAGTLTVPVAYAAA